MARSRSLFWLSLSLLVCARRRTSPDAWAQPRPPAPAPLFTAMMGGDARRSGQSATRGPRTEPHVAWRFRTRRRVFGSPAVDAQGRAVFGSLDGTVHAVDGAGVERWAWSGADRVFSSPAIVGDLTLIGHDGNAFIAIDPRGARRWAFSVSEDADSSALVAPDGTLYVASHSVSAVDREGHGRYVTALQGHVFGAPALGPDGTLWLPELSGGLTCVRASTGEVIRRITLATTLYGGVTVLPDGAAVLAGGDGKVRAYNPDGARRWEVTLQGAAQGLGCRGTPAIARDGTVVVGSDDGGIYGLAPADGHTVWRAATLGPVRSSARVDADGWMYLGSEDDRVYALDPQGTVMWSVTLGADVDSTPALLPDGTLVVGCDDGALYALR